jgi:hypothetical protein
MKLMSGWDGVLFHLCAVLTAYLSHCCLGVLAGDSTFSNQEVLGCLVRHIGKGKMALAIFEDPDMRSVGIACSLCNPAAHILTPGLAHLL